jgi:hypothetical protein
MNIELLAQFCTTDTWLNYSTPFSDQNYTYGSDGAVIIRVPRIEEITRPSPVDLSQLCWDDPGEWFDVPKVTPSTEHCDDCKGLGCYECGQSGVIYLNDPVDIGGVKFCDKMVELIGRLPNVKIAPRRVPAKIKFDGGDGLVMPRTGYI